ncbi:hypothetical protein FOM00_06320 [Pseudomonas sp. ST1]|nr:hypothetical protein FOM00_06320 [Pseudomonas sp. ST1]
MSLDVRRITVICKNIYTLKTASTLLSCHLPPATCHLPPATCHLPPATCHLWTVLRWIEVSHDIEEG